MNDTPKITVITPSFNQGDFLERTIRSVIDQGYPNLEYLVFDGGSTDQSVEIIRKYEEDISFWTSEPDRGQSHAVNKGFERSTGEIIGWLNSDDTFLPDCFAKVVEAFRRHPDAGAVYGDFVYIDENDGVLRKRKLFKKFRYETLLFHDYLGQPAVFFRRDVLKKIGPLDESLKFAMDWDFFLRMKRATRMVHVDACLATYRIHSESKSSAEGSERYKADLVRIHRKNRIQVFRNRLLDNIYFRIYKVISLVQRLLTAIRDNPFHFFRVYRHITGGRYFRGIIWRFKYY